MNYALAKQLKDSGFPNREHLATGVAVNDNGAWISPTLSELIEACPRIIENQDDYYCWFFLNCFHDAWFAGYQEDDREPEIRVEGATKEEAVAKLWLELNKKGQ